MTSTWEHPVHMHPWFRMPSLKRKAYSREDYSSDNSDHEPYVHPAKRLRCGVLESGFAQLSLDTLPQEPSCTPGRRLTAFSQPSPVNRDSRGGVDPTRQDTIQPVASIPSDNVDVAWYKAKGSIITAESPQPLSIVLPDSVEESMSPEVQVELDMQDVTMKSRSWYEPEKDRIVVVDLDDSDAEDSASDLPAVIVNSALLSHIRDQREPHMSAQLSAQRLTELPVADQSKALVLFRSLPVPDQEMPTRRESDTPNKAQMTGQDVSTSTSKILNFTVGAGDVSLSSMDVDDAMDIE